MSLIEKKQSISYILSLFMVLGLLSGAYFFLSVLGLSLGRWLAFNACSLSIIAYLVCFIAYQISKKEVLLAIPILPLYYYGSMGLFLMPWNAANAFPQATHIIISLTVIWLVYRLLKEGSIRELGIGLLIGIAVFVPIFAYIQSFTQQHISEFLQVLSKIQ